MHVEKVQLTPSAVTSPGKSEEFLSGEMKRDQAVLSPVDSLLWSVRNVCGVLRVIFYMDPDGVDVKNRFRGFASGRWPSEEAHGSFSHSTLPPGSSCPLRGCGPHRGPHAVDITVDLTMDLTPWTSHRGPHTTDLTMDLTITVDITMDLTLWTSRCGPHAVDLTLWTSL